MKSRRESQAFLQGSIDAGAALCDNPEDGAVLFHSAAPRERDFSVISVIVVGKNEGERLSACLESVNEALRSLHHEVLYVDSRSGDDSVSRALSAGARVFRLQETDTTAGLGRRVGAALAKGEWLLFLDGDMRLCPGFMQKAMLAADRYSADGITGIRTDEFVKNGTILAKTENVFGCETVRVCPAFGGAILLAKRALDAAGSWSADTVSCEEAELHARLISSGAKILEIPEPFIIHTDTVREERGLRGILFSRRRLGEGQALRCAMRMKKASAYLSFERVKFLFWLLDAASVLSLLYLRLPGLLPAAFSQCLQLGFFASRRSLRAFVSQKLFFFAMPAGLFLSHRRSEGYEEVTGG